MAPYNEPASDSNPQLDALFHRWRFAHVFDLASSLNNTLALRSRIDRGELRGPHFLMVGEPLWSEVPSRIRDFLAQHHLDMPEVMGREVQRSG